MLGKSPPAPISSPRRALHWFRNALIGSAGLLVLLFVVGASYQLTAQLADSRRFPHQGRLVALGPSFAGLFLNINCTGQGSPTVVMDTGGGIPAVGWSLVQPEITKFTRVCSYDRAGYGWSGTAGPERRTSLQIATELHALLVAAGEKPPYVLVAHSLGGFDVRIYNHEYPGEVSGMVLVDASHEDQLSHMAPTMRAFMEGQGRSLTRSRVIVPVLIYSGLIRALNSGRSAQAPHVPDQLAKEMLYLQFQPKFVNAVTSELEAMFPESADEVRAAGNLGDKPLIVLTAGKPDQLPVLPKGVTQRDVDDFHIAWVNDLQVQETHLSTHGKQVIVTGSDHMIPFERPDTIISAVREVCMAVNFR
jgi:pimeloyl-ACP methyl ester carboxylesterase